jgi:cell division protein FtsL
MALRKRKNFLNGNRVLSLIFNPEYLPFSLSFLFLAVMYVTIRMKTIEQTYALNKLNAKIEKNLIRNKELKAERARLLSANHLRTIAENFNLKEPGPEQIILIPE